MLIYYYAKWHYTRAPYDAFGVWRNFLWFVVHFFSIPILLRTLFSPFQRLSERYQGGIDFQNLAEVLIINILMRVMGFLIRSFVILLGVAFLLLVAVLGAAFIVLWFFIPIVIPGIAAFGVALMVL